MLSGEKRAARSGIKNNLPLQMDKQAVSCYNRRQ